jgi:hypothetical protein
VSVEGVDYSYARPSPVKLHAAGKLFACRYLSVSNSQTVGKILTRAEANALIDAGLAVVSNFEYQAGDARGGFSAGARYAVVAEQQARAAGMPPDRPIYFSVDWDASLSDLTGPVAAYFQGIASVLGVKRTGAYGGCKTIDFLFDHKLITWGWQTYAWSGGRWDARAHIQQYRNGVNVAGGDCDLDRAMTADYGQWGQDMPLSDADIDRIVDKVISGLTADKEFLAAVGKATWTADVIDNKYYPWRPDSPAHDPAPAPDDVNLFITGKTAVTEAANRADAAFKAALVDGGSGGGTTSTATGKGTFAFTFEAADDSTEAPAP